MYQFASAQNALSPVDALRESMRLGTPPNTYKKPNCKTKGLVVIGTITEGGMSSRGRQKTAGERPRS
jgi:hypothetical protein